MENGLMYEMPLSTGKVVVIREPKIADQELAANAVSNRAGNNALSFMMLIQSELMKMLIVSVNGKVLSGLEKENLDNHFNYAEYSELQLGMQEILGEVKRPQISIVKTSGNK